MNPNVTNIQRLRNIILRCVGLLLFITSLHCYAIPAWQHDAFDRGWSAYEQGQNDIAFQIWQGLAEQGHVYAQINLGVMYDDGRGLEPNPRMAAKWYREAARESSTAQFNLGLMYAQGRGVEHDYAQAAHWYHKAAEAGLANAQFNLGMLYASGNGVGRDSDDARLWLRRAAQQGFAEAQFNLAAMFGEAEDQHPDPFTAAEWYYQAANTYLGQGDSANAASVVQAMRAEHPGSQLLRDLEARLGLAPGLGESPVDSLPSGLSVGTAWPIAAGYAVTNNHVVANLDEFALLNVKGEQITAHVVLRDEVNDLAVLMVNDPSRLPPALPLAKSRASLGTNVFTIGYPRIDVMGRTPKLSDGIVSTDNGLYDNPGTYQLSVSIQPGNSGGPLLNMQGEVVGVVAAMLGEVDANGGAPRILPNVSFAIKVERVQELLGLLPDQGVVLQELPKQTASLPQLADRIQDSVMIVMAW